MRDAKSAWHVPPIWDGEKWGYYLVPVPNTTAYKALLRGALLLLTEPENWDESTGDIEVPVKIFSEVFLCMADLTEVFDNLLLESTRSADALERIAANLEADTGEGIEGIGNIIFDLLPVLLASGESLSSLAVSMEDISNEGLYTQTDDNCGCETVKSNVTFSDCKDVQGMYLSGTDVNLNANGAIQFGDAGGGLLRLRLEVEKDGLAVITMDGSTTDGAADIYCTIQKNGSFVVQLSDTDGLVVNETVEVFTGDTITITWTTDDTQASVEGDACIVKGGDNTIVIDLQSGTGGIKQGISKGSKGKFNVKADGGFDRPAIATGNLSFIDNIDQFQITFTDVFDGTVKLQTYDIDGAVLWTSTTKSVTDDTTFFEGIGHVMYSNSVGSVLAAESMAIFIGGAADLIWVQIKNMVVETIYAP